MWMSQRPERRAHGAPHAAATPGHPPRAVSVRARPGLALAAMLALCLACSGNAGGQMNTEFFPKGPAARLEAAIRADDAAGVNAALAAGVDVNLRGVSEVTPLMLAVDAQRPAAVAALLARGAQPNLVAADGRSAISLAVDNYRSAPAILQALIAAGGNPNARRADGDPVLMRFVNDRHCEAIRWMKSQGANLELRTRAGDALVTDAAVAGDWDVVWCLLELGADPDPPGARLSLARLLKSRTPAPDSPIYAHKQRVWAWLNARGAKLPPLSP